MLQDRAAWASGAVLIKAMPIGSTTQVTKYLSQVVKRMFVLMKSKYYKGLAATWLQEVSLAKPHHTWTRI